MWFVIAMLFVLVMMVLTRNQWFPRGAGLDVGQMLASFFKFFAVGIVGAFVLTFLFECLVIVPAGHRGVIFDRFKGVQQKQLEEGFNLIIPFIQEATLIDVRIQKVEFDATAASRDLQSVHAKVALNCQVIPEKVSSLFQVYGVEYNEKVIHPALQEAVKATTARYTAEELITKREEVKNQIHELLQSHMSPAHLKLVETYITDFEFSPEFSRAIESKQIAEQQALKAKRDLDRIKIESEQKVAQASAEAEGLRMQREVLTPQLVELRRIDAQKLAIEKWDGKLPSVILGDSMPMINLSDFPAAGK